VHGYAPASRAHIGRCGRSLRGRQCIKYGTGHSQVGTGPSVPSRLSASHARRDASAGPRPELAAPGAPAQGRRFFTDHNGPAATNRTISPVCPLRCRVGKQWRLPRWSCSGRVLPGQLELETASVPRLPGAALRDVPMAVEFRRRSAGSAAAARGQATTRPRGLGALPVPATAVTASCG
jgi:hypothetical protein